MLAIVATSFTLFVITYRKKSVYSSIFFPIVFLAIAIYVLGYVFEAFAYNIAQGYASLIVKYCGAPYIPPLVLLTMLDYYRRRPKLPVVALLFLPPAINTILVATWSINGIYYETVNLVSTTYFTQLIVQPSPVYFVFYGYGYIIFALILVYAIRYGLPSPVKRHNTIVLIFAMVLPVVFNVAYVVGFTPGELDFIPYSTILTLSVLVYAIFRLDAIDILPQAKEILLDNMDDALIVINRKKRLIFANNSAKRLFPILLGTNDEELLSDILPGLSESMKVDDDFELELPGESGKNSYYYFSQNNISHNTKTVGYCLIFRDITENRNKMKKLQAEAEYDGLTKIYNHSTFNDLARKSMIIADAEHANSCMFYIDLDHFKKINDTYGHMYGDLVLQNVVETIKEKLRRSDLFGRIGGEEFGVFFTNIPLESACILAEKIRQSVGESAITYQDEKVSVTISIGIAISEPDSELTYEELRVQADSALYLAKNNGRNRVEIFTNEEK